MPRRPRIRQFITVLVLLGTSASAGAATLLDAYQLALESDPQLRQAEAELRAVATGEHQATSAVLPQLTASGNITRNREEILSSESDLPGFQPQTIYTTNQSYGVQLNQTIYSREFFIRLAQADTRTAEAEAEYNATRQALLVRVAERYFDVLGAMDNLDFAQAEKEAIQRQLEQAQERYDVGLIAVTDVREAEAAFDRAKAQEIAAQNQLASARESLQELTGQRLASLETPSSKLPLSQPEPQDIETWIDTALEQNFQVLAARFGTESARQQIKLQRAGRYPTLDVVGNVTYNDFSGGNFGGRETVDAAIGLQLNMPFYQGGGVSARTREAEHRQDQSRARLEEQRRGAIRQTRDAYLSIQSAISEVQALKQAVISSETALEATQAGFEVGTRTIVDVLDTQRQLYGAQRDFARARYDYVLATLRLKQAAGTVSLADVEHLSRWFEPRAEVRGELLPDVR